MFTFNSYLIIYVRKDCLILNFFSLIWPLIAFWPQFLLRIKKCHSWFLIAFMLTQSNLINIYCIQCFPFSDVFSFRIWIIYSWLPWGATNQYIINLKNRVEIFQNWCLWIEINMWNTISDLRWCRWWFSWVKNWQST